MFLNNCFKVVSAERNLLLLEFWSMHIVIAYICIRIKPLKLKLQTLNNEMMVVLLRCPTLKWPLWKNRWQLIFISECGSFSLLSIASFLVISFPLCLCLILFVFFFLLPRWSIYVEESYMPYSRKDVRNKSYGIWVY